VKKRSFYIDGVECTWCDVFPDLYEVLLVVERLRVVSGINHLHVNVTSQQARKDHPRPRDTIHLNLIHLLPPQRPAGPVSTSEGQTPLPANHANAASCPLLDGQ